MPGNDGGFETESLSGVSRRRFLQLLGANVAAASLAGCTRAPAGKILPYVRRPPEIVPGMPLSYATAMPFEGYGIGLLVQAREGRPVKIEGNPDHPASLGVAGLLAEASLLDLYDPSRTQGIRQDSAPRGWRDVVRVFGAERADRGDGLRLLLEPTSSPLRASLIARLNERHPRSRVYYYAPGDDAAPLVAARAMLGRPAIPQYAFDRADVIVGFGADFLASGPSFPRWAHGFAARRAPGSPHGSMSRLYLAETSPSATGMLADHRLRARPSELRPLATLLVREIARGRGAASDGFRDPDEELLTDTARRWAAAAAEDLIGAGGRSIVLAGGGTTTETHAAALAANALLDNEGKTVGYTECPILEAGENAHDIGRLAGEIRDGAVDTLIVMEGNPAYDAPADLDFAALLAKPKTTVRLGLRDDETAARCRWFVTSAHYLESWGDARAYDGTISPMQPLITPLRNGRTPDELLAVLAGGAADPYTLLRELYASGLPREGGGERAWEEALSRGFLPESALPWLGARARVGGFADLLEKAKRTEAPHALELRLALDSPVYDGRYATNLWLLELPHVASKLTWENAALVSLRTAERLGVSTEDVVEIVAGERRLEVPVLPLPGHADGSVTLALGWGRRRPDSPGRGAGVDAYPLRTTTEPWVVPNVRLRRLPGQRRRLSITQWHQTQHDRPIVLSHTLDEYARHPDFTADQRGPVDTLYEAPGMTAPNQWAMTIDESLCTGCSACMIACQAENNVPTVGKVGVRNRREMYWLRIDHYVDGSHEDPELLPQPMLCQHCEKAPCEYVCPVNATVHSSDGLNEMIYNRCVGTRFCSNNCPYKVRRFNWFDFNANRSDLERLVLNPDVTVRERGVMEKCTYCVQRIRRTEIRAAVEGRPIRDGEVRTACQQACPTHAIVFGSLTHPQSEVTRSRNDPRAYEELHDLGTVPRTRYLARITNPHPGLPRFASATRTKT